MQKKANEFTNKHWRLPEQRKAQGNNPLSAFKTRLRDYSLSLSGMGFQDAWNIDIGRLRGCCVHVITRDCRAISLCAFHLTSASGERLYTHHG